MNNKDNITATSEALKCQNCGSVLYFEPGTQQLKCDHCGSTNDIHNESENESIECYDYNEFIEDILSAPAHPDLQQVKCNNCGSKTALPQNVTADKCPFCASPLVIDLDPDQGYVKPHYVLPFAINHQSANEIFKQWVKKLSFAPSGLLQKINNGSAASLDGVYLPYWSFDADADTVYQGRRGDHYWETETYTEEIDGKTYYRTRQVMHTNWRSVSGSITTPFRNIIIPASSSLAKEMLDKIAFWDMKSLTAYDEGYISGFRSENYQLVPQKGLELAQKGMAPVIKNAICEDIGGDEQKIKDSLTTLSNVGVKYLLLPVWVMSYVYNKKSYQVSINARTGLIHGHRPYSIKKIALLILVILIAFVILGMLSSYYNK
jgi:hypothetical protein